MSSAVTGRWALAIALGFLIIGVPVIAWVVRQVWWLLWGRRRGGQEPGLYWGRSLVVGDDNRVSTSKTTALIWTYSVAGALLSFVIARWLGHAEGFNALTTQGLNAQYAVLIGGPLGAAILAKGIVSSQVGSGSVAKPKAGNATPGQLVQNDAGDADLGDVQYLLFNVVALVFFYGQLLRAPQAGMPTIPDVLLGLTSVSAVGFVGKKTLVGPGAIANVQPLAGKVGDAITIATAGIIQAADDLPGVTVTFGKSTVSPGSMTAATTTSLGVLIRTRVPPEAAGEVDVSVSVPTGKPSTWPGFKVIPEIPQGQNLVGRRHHAITVQTKGVTGLGQLLPGLVASIGGEKADAILNGDGELQVTVPASAPTGPTALALVTPGGQAEAPVTIVA
jgi:hypothetical protein